MRHFRFKRSMLNGHPGNVTLAVKRVIVRGTNGGLIVTSTTDGRHAPRSFHNSGRAVDLGHARPGTPEARYELVRFQRFLLKRFGAAAFIELFGPDNQSNVKNGGRVALDEGSALENAHDNHDHVVPARLLPLPKRVRKPLSRAAKVRKARRAGAEHVYAIFAAARKHRISYPLALALFEKESNFLNQWGHDRNSHGALIFPAIPGRKMVNEKTYKAYKAGRALRGNQGVGLGQLTSPGIQDMADRRGGAWRVKPNVDVSLEILAGHIRALGLRRGIGAYNGGRGNPQLGYADDVLKLRDKWSRILYKRD